MSYNDPPDPSDICCWVKGGWEIKLLFRAAVILQPLSPSKTPPPSQPQHSFEKGKREREQSELVLWVAQLMLEDGVGRLDPPHLKGTPIHLPHPPVPAEKPRLNSLYFLPHTLPF